MEELNPKDQKKLHVLLERYDDLIEQLEKNSSEIDSENAKKLHDLYDAISEILKSIKE